MSAETDGLIAQALAWAHGLDDGEIPSMLDAQSLITALADALEAAEAQRDARLTEDESRVLAFKVTDLEAQRDTLAEAAQAYLDCGEDAPAHWIASRLDNLAVALAGVAPPEEQP